MRPSSLLLTATKLLSTGFPLPVALEAAPLLTGALLLVDNAAAGGNGCGEIPLAALLLVVTYACIDASSHQV